ncbi:T9SS type B sorting domain-containing protein [Mucilaginibacter psychrotolerans]|nr:gliding motility-associated C-terminal domain-containing protein [Mucilaginibacter psychrotolerans]
MPIRATFAAPKLGYFNRKQYASRKITLPFPDTLRLKTSAVTQPVITPLPGPVVLKLKADGTYAVTFDELATVTPVNNVITNVSPNVLTCNDLGAKNITLSAQLIQLNPGNVSFNNPGVLLVNADGSIIVSDNGNNSLRLISKDGVVTTILEGILGPSGIAKDKEGNIYAVAAAYDEIYKLAADGTFSKVAGNINNTQHSTDGSKDVATFAGVYGIAVDDAGNLYVTESTNKIRKVTPDGSVVTIAGSEAHGTSDGIGVLAQFDNPLGITFSSDGNLYVADGTNNAIRRVTLQGVVTTIAGSKNSPEFRNPSGVAADDKGNLYVADQDNSRIRKVAADGSITTINFTTTEDISTFDKPTAVGVDAAGNVFVVDHNNNVIRRITPTGVMETYAGSALYGNKDGNVSAAAGPPVTQQVVVQVVNESPEAEITITAEPATAACVGSTVKFTAAIKNTGDNVTYQWHLNGVDIAGATAATYSNNNFTDGDKISCTVKFNDVNCATPREVTSEPTPVVVNMQVSPGISIAADNKSVCAGTLVNFTVTPVNGGTAPQFQWRVNDIDVAGANQSTYSSNSLANGDKVTCKLTSAAPCTVPSPDVVSDEIAMQVLPVITPQVSVTPQSPTACKGQLVVFNAQINNNVSAPNYQWLVNDVPLGADSPVFSGTDFNDNDKITCKVTAGKDCRSTGASMPVYIKINPLPSVTYKEFNFIQKGGSVKLSPISSEGVVSYAWINNTAGLSNTTIADPIASPSENTTYTLKVTSVYGCEYLKTITVTVAPILSSVINTFTPNGDGVNDVWSIPELAFYTNCRVSVFNRYGIVVYSSIGYSKPWDGSSNGTALPTGTYYYIIYPLKTSGPLTGTVTIIR